MKAEKKITTLFVDIGNVLLSNGWGHDFRRLAAEKFQLDFAEMEVRHSIIFDTYEEGKITLTEYLDRVVFHRERNFSAAEFREYMFSLSTPHDDMIAFLKKIKKQYGLKIVAVSNEGRDLNAYRIEKFRLNDVFDFFVSSCYVQLRKPNPAIYQLALDLSYAIAEEVVYIDDVQMFVDIATDLSIRSIRHVDFLSTSAALATMGLTAEENKNA